MRVTICELPDEPEALQRAWEPLVRHVAAQRSELVLLPETPFCSWFARERSFDARVWAAAVAAHDEWERRIAALAPATLVCTRPMDFGNQRYLEAVIIGPDGGVRSLHAKSHLTHQPGSWESSWYQPAAADFVPARIEDARVGALLWLTEQARLYGAEGTDLLVTPRASGARHFNRWLRAARQAAVRAAAFSVSSNRVGAAGAFDGRGWVIGPAGDVIALTSREQPFVSVALDLAAQRRARHPNRRPQSAATGTAAAFHPPGESPMLIEHLMTRTVHTCGPEDSLASAAQIMWEHDVGCLPVCSSNGVQHVVGMITDRDICMCALFQGRPLADLKVAAAMSREVRSCSPSDPIASVERTLAQAQIRRMPVVDGEGGVVGIVALADLAREASRQRSRSPQELTQAQIGDAYRMISGSTSQPAA